ncbi:MAG: hypothetical protein DRP70_07560 [Spirochaetes bacterium]|nr:MAG: hypothetical protein DRP70_07560 [Spirochaetota bacterium]
MYYRRQMNNHSSYSLGLSSFPLLTGETITAAAIFQETGRNSGETRSRLKSSNLLQRRHFSTSEVAVREVVKRLAHADEWELENLSMNQDITDSSFICFLLVSRQYPILLELIRGLIKYKFDARDTTLQNYELESWFYGFLEENPPRREIRESTFGRLVINARQILREAGLISPAEDYFTIHRPRVSPGLRTYYENLKKGENLEMLLFSTYQINQIMGSRRGKAS